MRRLRIAGLMLGLVLTAGPTCGEDLGNKRRGQPCTRNRECAEGLICMGGTCMPPDGGAAQDGGADGG